MSPFLSTRLWMRQGPSSERWLTGLLALGCTLLLVVAALPGLSAEDGSGDALLAGSAEDPAPAGSLDAAGGGSEGVVGPSGQASAVEGSGVAGGSGPAEAAVPEAAGQGGGVSRPGRTVAAPGGAATAAAPDCGTLAATDQGVTAKQITVAAVLVDLGAANGTINLPPVEDQRKAYNAVADQVNLDGGVRCRKVVVRFFSDNPLDASAAHATCLEIQDANVFVAFNNLFAPQETTCLAKAKIPNIWYTPPHTPDVRRYSPYILSWQPDYDQLIRHYVRGAKSQGWFTGLEKLGILEQSCYPDENEAIRRELTAIGIDPGKAEVFNYGCSGAPVSTPEQDQAAALQFKREGVTHVLNVAYGSISSFSRAADQQAYDPEYAMMEDAAATAIQSGTSKPGDGFDGTLLVTTIETGATNTPGYRYGAATTQCAKTLTAAGLPAPYATDGAKFFGIACTNLIMFKAAAEAAPELVRTQLGAGLVRAGALDLAFPSGPLQVRDTRLPTGGQLWRPGRWVTACQCWRVTDVRYRSGY
jgi:hypothetical protein